MGFVSHTSMSPYDDYDTRGHVNYSENNHEISLVLSLLNHETIDDFLAIFWVASKVEEE